MSDEPRLPQLEHLLDLVIQIALDSIHATLPAKIVEYDPVKQSASIQILLQKAHVDEQLERVPEILPILHMVPVCFHGSQWGRLTFPVKVGDVGLAHFSSLSTAKWRLMGGVVDPQDDVRHDLNDCFFVPGGHDYAHVPTDAPTDAVVVHAGAGVKVKIGGSDATQKAVGDSALTAFGVALNQAIAELTEATDPAASALQALASKLGISEVDGTGWSAGTTVTEIK